MMDTIISDWNTLKNDSTRETEELFELKEAYTIRYNKAVEDICRKCKDFLHTVNLAMSSSAFEILPPALLNLAFEVETFSMAQGPFWAMLNNQLLPSCRPPISMRDIYRLLQSVSKRTAELRQLNINVQGEDAYRLSFYTESRKIDYRQVARDLIPLLDLVYNGMCKVYHPQAYQESEIQSIVESQLEQYSQSHQTALENYTERARLTKNPLAKLSQEFSGFPIVQQYLKKPDLVKLIGKWRNNQEYWEKDLLVLFDYICKYRCLVDLTNDKPVKNLHVHVHKGGQNNMNLGETHFHGKTKR